VAHRAACSSPALAPALVALPSLRELLLTRRKITSLADEESVVRGGGGGGEKDEQFVGGGAVSFKQRMLASIMANLVVQVWLPTH
jgi:hypothetical protein